MKTPKSLYSRLALTTSVTLVVGYFVVYAAWTSISDVTCWQTLTATLINNILGNLTDLDTRISNFTFSAGNVGIGASPAEKLHVSGNLYMWNGTADTIVKLGGSDYEWQVKRDYTDNGKFKIKYLQGGLDALTIGRDGKVWIGTSTPSDTLTVNGGVTANTFTSPVAWSAIPAAAGWTTSNAACRRIGSFLQIKKYIYYTSGVVTPIWATVVWTLPAECRPSVSLYIPSVCWTNTHVASACLAFIDIDGKIYLDASSSLDYFSFAGTHPVD